MKMSRMFCVLTRKDIPAVASSSSAKYSPTCSVNLLPSEMRAVAIVSERMTALTSCESGLSTNMPSR